MEVALIYDFVIECLHIIEHEPCLIFQIFSFIARQMLGTIVIVFSVILNALNGTLGIFLEPADKIC